jgi:hypothetical protein
MPGREGRGKAIACSLLMVDNARDLQQPQEEDPRSSERRSVTWSAYVGSGSSSGGDGGGDAKKAAAPAVKK